MRHIGRSGWSRATRGSRSGCGRCCTWERDSTRWTGWVLGVASIAMLAHGCGFHALRREIVPPGALSGVDHRRDTVLKAHLRDGQMVVFTSWELVDHDRMIRGTGQLYDVNRRPQGERSFELAVDA